jgi:hypothetical protein
MILSFVYQLLCNGLPVIMNLMTLTTNSLPYSTVLIAVEWQTLEKQYSKIKNGTQMWKSLLNLTAKNYVTVISLFVATTSKGVGRRDTLVLKIPWRMNK